MSELRCELRRAVDGEHLLIYLQGVRYKGTLLPVGQRPNRHAVVRLRLVKCVTHADGSLKGVWPLTSPLRALAARDANTCSNTSLAALRAALLGTRRRYQREGAVDRGARRKRTASDLQTSSESRDGRRTTVSQRVSGSMSAAPL